MFANKIISYHGRATLPARRSQYRINQHIMGFRGHGRDDLRVKRHSALVPVNPGQQPVVKAFPAPQPMASQVKTYARHQNQVQLV
jgi:hypothetical protein